MDSNTSSTSPGNLTVKGYFNTLSDRYTAEVVNGAYESTNADYQKIIYDLLIQFEELWRRIGAMSAFSANDDLDDYTTTALEFLWIPYILGDLYQRLQVFSNSMPEPRNMQSHLGESVSTTTSQTISAYSKAHSNEPQHMLNYGRKVSNDGDTNFTDSSTGTKDAHVGVSVINEVDVLSLSRKEALARSHGWFKIFFDWLQNAGLMEEHEIKTFSEHLPDQRSLRIQLSRTCSELKQKFNQCEAKVQYERVRRQRMQELMAENGESVEEHGGEEEALLRERAIARLRWSGYDACHQLQLSSRELEMLQSLNIEQQCMISAQYQKTLDAVRRGEVSRGRHTYTILPGGMMMAGSLLNPQPIDLTPDLQKGTVSRGVINSQAINAASSAQLFRQKVREELMVERNPPTMSLDEFANKEMANVERQMAEALALRAQEEEDNARLGPEGVEENQRKKDSRWQDWKDDHPAYGITNKGNYA